MQFSQTKKSLFKHLLLFAVTLLTTTLAGAEWMHNKLLFYGSERLTLKELTQGWHFSLPLIGFLTIHELGHYFTARFYKLRVTLPYYLPLWTGFLSIPSIGTFGAVIKIKEPILSRKTFFDVGIAGPLAGFFAALSILYGGFTHLPPPDYIFTIHPEYAMYGHDYAHYVYEDGKMNIALGRNLVFLFFEKLVVSDPTLLPNQYEIIHYPWIFAGFLALFFTALNLFPIGQLDGGHILYGLVGKKKYTPISLTLFFLLVFYGGLGLISPYSSLKKLLIVIPLYIGFLYFTFQKLELQRMFKLLIALAIFTAQLLFAYWQPHWVGYHGWFVFAFLLGRVIKVHHPPTIQNAPLDTKRKILGWAALFIFIICFSPQPFIMK